MVQKKLKKPSINSSKKEELYYSSALLENMDSKIDVILEGYQVLDKKISDLGEELNEKINVFRQEVDHKFERVFDELHLIRNELKEKVGRDEFIVLEKRVAMLEKKGVK